MSNTSDLQPSQDVHMVQTSQQNSEEKLQTLQFARILQKQNQVMEMFVSHLRQSSLPVPKISSFAGDPLEYKTFIRAFESLVEAKTTSEKDRLYFLEQHTTGEVKDLVKSCHFLPEDKGYSEARKILKRKYGNEYKIATAYVNKALNWPELKSEDAASLHTFSVFLSSCNNAMSDNAYMTKFDHSETLRSLMLKLPFTMRTRWRRLVDKIIEEYPRPTYFKDFVDFVNQEARIASNPVFGNITSMPEQKTSKRPQRLNERTKSVKASTFTATAIKPSYLHEETKEVNTNQPLKLTKEGEGEGAIPSTQKSCLFCEGNHILDQCQILRKKPYQERINFLAKTKLCFGCLKTTHLAKNCPNRSKCKIKDCQKRHPTVLHTSSTWSKQVNEKAAAPLNAHTGYTNTKSNKTSMAVLPVKVWSNSLEAPIITYAFLDTGSNTTFCTERLLIKLGVHGQPKKIDLTTIDTENKVVQSNIVRDLEISDLEEINRIKLSMLFTRPSIPVNSQDIPTQEDISNWSYLNDIQIPSIDSSVDILIGCDNPKVLEPREVRHSQEGGPYASRTVLGWTINGPLGTPKGKCTKSFQIRSDKALTQLIENYYNQDFEDATCDGKSFSVDEQRFMTNANNTCQLIDGHYSISLPFKEEVPSFPDNKQRVIHRLNLLKGRLLKNDKLLRDYKVFMNDLLKKGFAEEVPQESLERNDNKVWYLPHHGVYHPHKPEKVRVVFDCSAIYQGTSLNSKLLKGPDLTNTLVGVLTRFRQFAIAIMADIEAMFHQVNVTDTDRDVLRFLWWPEGDLDQEPKTYHMNVHLFGAVSSPSTANYAVRRSADDNQDLFSNGAIKTVQRNFYVDDLLKSYPTVKEAIANAREVCKLLSNGGFRLTKWISNDIQVIESIPKEERAKGIKELNLTKDVHLPVERALGVKWCIDSDCLGFSVTLKERPPTRRGILSIISSIYDPLGLIAPLILPAKLLLQEITRQKLGWDEEIPTASLNKWIKWQEDILKIADLQVNRAIIPANFGAPISSELHHFSDASHSALSSVCYLRLCNEEGDIHCAFLIGKSRLAPLKQTTIPRLELGAATVSAKLNTMMKRELDYKIDESRFWTDSTSVLAYIENESRRFHTFVANRTAYIRERSKQSEWGYVSSKLNPADEGSRGTTSDEFTSKSTWLKGPEFLWKEKQTWPKDPKTKPELLDTDPEVRKVMASTAAMTDEDSSFEQMCLKFSSWHRLKNAIAIARRYITKLKEAAQKRKQGKSISLHTTEMKLEPVTVDEMATAESIIIHNVQRQVFQEELRCLTRHMKERIQSIPEQDSSTQVKKSSTILKLDPILKGDLICVGGRLKNVESIPESSRHQIILPKGHHISKLLIDHFHRISGHSGRQHVLSLLRRKYWIIHGNSAVRTVLNNCVNCRRRQVQPSQQKMADLPVDRSLHSEPPFTAVGLDYFGPFIVRRGRTTVKRYGVIFTCLAIRAIHIEIAHHLDTDSFLLALRRFIARRGQVREIRSDNGTNLRGGEKELRESIQQWNQNTIHQHLLQKEIKWTFNPPYASHQGGIWERCIRTIRKVLRAVMKEQVLDDESLQTYMCEVEAIINGRPITPVSSDPRDLEALTPNHLLLLQGDPALPPGVFQPDENFSKRRWRQVQHLANLFWKRWTREYLPLLQIRQKWQRPSRNHAVGDIVLIYDHSTPRNQWPLGRIVSVNKDRRGYVRSATVKTSNTTLERPITKLYHLMET